MCFWSSFFIESNKFNIVNFIDITSNSLYIFGVPYKNGEAVNESYRIYNLDTLYYVSINGSKDHTIHPAKFKEYLSLLNIDKRH